MAEFVWKPVFLARKIIILGVNGFIPHRFGIGLGKMADPQVLKQIRFVSLAAGILADWVISHPRRSNRTSKCQLCTSSPANDEVARTP